jgi:hypothetical protein
MRDVTKTSFSIVSSPQTTNEIGVQRTKSFAGVQDVPENLLFDCFVAANNERNKSAEGYALCRAPCPGDR